MKHSDSILFFHLLFVFLLGRPLRGGETLAELDAQFAAHLEKLDFDATAAVEELLARHLRRVAALEQASQLQGDFSGVLAAKAFQERLRTQRDPGAEITTPPAIASAWKECSIEWTRIRDAESRKRVELTSKYHAYLTAQVSNLTKAGKLIEAKPLHQRAQEMLPASPTLAARSPMVPVPASPPSSRLDIPALLKSSHPAFWVDQKGWRSLPLEKLEITVTPKGTRLIFHDRDAHAKLVLGKEPLRVGDEWVVEAVGLHALEVVLPAEPWQSMTFKTPDREAVHRFRLTRTAEAIAVECNGNPHPGPDSYALAKKDLVAFLASNPHPCLLFYGKNTPRLLRMEHHPAATRTVIAP